ncbi:hypothetical protein D3C72_2126610 [compost metagenome]
MFVGNAAADKVAHQHRHQRNAQTGCHRHGVGFGVGQRGEHPAFLRLQGEHRNEGQRDNQQTAKQRRPHLHRRLL